MDHTFDSDAMLDANKHEKAGRFARPIWWSEDDGSLNENPWWGDDTDDTSGDLTFIPICDACRRPIWWDPENPDSPPVDSVEPIAIDDGSGRVPTDSPDDPIMY